METMQKMAELIDGFIGGTQYYEAASALFKAFGGETLPSGPDDGRLLSSFKRNLALLVQKTWVESTDVALKDSVLYRLEHFRATNAQWRESYEPFLSLIRDAVYLMFGGQSREEDFGEYAMRIDPEFGVFWRFISSLPENPSWPEDKYQKAIACGMSFLANY